MEKSNTRRQILQAALELFSTQGFEATSVSQIADAVGIRKASVYSHFESKQAILDALLQETLEQYDRRSLFAGADWDDPAFTAPLGEIPPERVAEKIQEQVRYILRDPWISRSRKLLTIEQFRNPTLQALRTRQNYTEVLRYFTGLVRFLIGRGRLAEGDAEAMAAQLCLPVSVWIELCDREPEREEAVMELIRRHVRQFFAIYGR